MDLLLPPNIRSSLTRSSSRADKRAVLSHLTQCNSTSRISPMRRLPSLRQSRRDITPITRLSAASAVSRSTSHHLASTNYVDQISVHFGDPHTLPHVACAISGTLCDAKNAALRSTKKPSASSSASLCCPWPPPVHHPACSACSPSSYAQRRRAGNAALPQEMRCLTPRSQEGQLAGAGRLGDSRPSRHRCRGLRRHRTHGCAAQLMPHGQTDGGVEVQQFARLMTAACDGDGAG